MQLVVFPFQVNREPAVDALVLPRLPIFLKTTIADGSSLVSFEVNRYLLALILLATRQMKNLYCLRAGYERSLLSRPGAVKKSLIKGHVRTLLRERLQEEQEKTQKVEERAERAEERAKELQEKLAEVIKELQLVLPHSHKVPKQ